MELFKDTTPGDKKVNAKFSIFFFNFNAQVTEEKQQMDATEF